MSDCSETDTPDFYTLQRSLRLTAALARRTAGTAAEGRAIAWVEKHAARLAMSECGTPRTNLFRVADEHGRITGYTVRGDHPEADSQIDTESPFGSVAEAAPGVILLILPNRESALEAHRRTAKAASTLGMPHIEQTDQGNWAVVALTADGGGVREIIHPDLDAPAGGATGRLGQFLTESID